MYQTPRRMWRTLSRIEGFGLIVWEILESCYQTEEEDDMQIPDRDGYGMTVYAEHYWDEESAREHYLRPASSPRYELILIPNKA
jgi:hypothetical protein